MARDLQTSSPVRLPAVDTAEPASMLLLPDWLRSQLGAVSDLGEGRTEVDPKTGQITARVPTIPASRMPNGPQRAAITQRITELREACRPGPVEDTINILGELIQEHAPAKLDAGTVRIKAEAYLDAVEDLPAWTVAEAIRRWRRGDVDADPQTLDFAPKPPRLRRIAERLAMVAAGQAARLERILAAEPEGQLTDAQRASNQKQLAGIIAQVAEGPIVEPVSEMSAERKAAIDDLARRKALREAAEAAAEASALATAADAVEGRSQ